MTPHLAGSQAAWVAAGRGGAQVGSPLAALPAAAAAAEDVLPGRWADRAAVRRPLRCSLSGGACVDQHWQ